VNSRKTTIDAWDKVAQAYQDKFMDMDLYNDTYNLFCDLVAGQDARVLEVGCGPGNISRYILSRNPSLQIHAIDASANMIILAKQNNPTIKCAVMDCMEIVDITDKFDGIICGFVMPYLSKEDCGILLRDCASLLNDGGIFYCSMIEDDYNKSGCETNSSGTITMHVYYHEISCLQQQLINDGFELINTIRKQYLREENKIETHLILISRKLTNSRAEL
jgi:2-polyprenyl-3-methyl-5-hydroxy-6-metoxy-1,4-benzoquinol methylase